MKIACQSCQAKYTIADEKVLGKIVKIRCKKCGATIVINGNEQEGATQALDTGAQQGGGVYDYTAGGGGESWTVNVSDGDQRTMTTAEIIDAFRGGVVNDETYCWKDGMADWLPLREVPELSAALQNGPQPSMHAHQSEAPPPQDDQPTQAGFSSLFGGGGGGAQQPDAGASLFSGGGSAPAAAAAPSAARRAGGRAAGGADLFGSAAAAGSEQDAMGGGQAAAAGAGAGMTGTRNENSVLFSLSALTANAPKEETPMAQGEGSGLIDIRALANNMNTPDKGPKKVDDIMNLGGGGAFSAALAAPVLAPPPADVADLSAAQTGGEQKKGNTGLIVGMIVGLLLFGGLIAGAIVYVMKPPTTATTTPTSTTTATATPTDTATAANTGGGTTGTAAPTGSVATADTGHATPTNTGGTGGNHATPTNTGAATVAANGTATTKPTSTGAAPSGGGKCGCAADDFQCNMACSATGSKPTTTATATANTAAAPFDKGAALSSLSGIASSLSSCKKPDGPTGSGKVTVTFEPSGNVSKVEFIEGPFGGTATGGCIAGKFRGAHIPPFAGGAVPANKSFVLN